jgi:hypothetical protein
MENGALQLQQRLEKMEADIEVCKSHTERVIIHLDFQKEILEELKNAVKELTGMRSDIAVLKTKSSWIGAIGGIIAFVAMAIIEFLRH